MAETHLTISYPTFVLGQIINPDEANQNNLEIVNKINDVVDEVNSDETNLETHKLSADHDGRYYTETEVDSKLAVFTTQETTRQTNEATRQSQEANRQATYTAFNDAETTRQTNEANRQATYTQFNDAEVTRVSNEGARASAESTRVANENTRISRENTRVANEDTRSSKELSRVSAETSRVGAETARVGAETARSSAESTRASQESTRQSQEAVRQANYTKYDTGEATRINNENTRVTNEGNRVSKENERLSAETTRLSNETGRVSAESSRVTSESARSTAETARASAETNRNNAESGRLASENTRVSSEATRVSQESTRQSQEGARQSQEVIRQSQESTRQSQESTRQSQEANRQATYTNYNGAVQTTQINWKGMKDTYALLPATGNVNGDTWSVTGDSDVTKNGVYRYNGTVYVKIHNFNVTGYETVANVLSESAYQAIFRQKQMHSGVIGLPVITTGSTTNLNSITIPAADYNINGNIISMPQTVVDCGTPPTTGTWDVLVFFEAYFPSNNPYQLSGRYRVVSNVNFITYGSDGFCNGVGTKNPNVVAQGGNASPVEAIATWGFNQAITSDIGLYVAGSGSPSSKTILRTYDGYSYAIPLFRVKRRNSSGYSPSNPNGARNWFALTGNYSFTSTPPGYTTSIALNATDYANVQVGDKFIFNTTYSCQLISKDSGTNVTILSTGTGAMGALNSIDVLSTPNHPQLLYSNVIDQRDITDLRHRTQVQYNYDYELKRGFDQFNRGELQQKKMMKVYHGIPKSEVDGNTVFYASLDGTTVAETGTAILNNVPLPTYKLMPTGSGLYIPNTGSLSFSFSAGLTNCTIDAVFPTDDLYARGSAIRHVMRLTYTGSDQIGFSADVNANKFVLMYGNGTTLTTATTITKPTTPYTHIRLRVNGSNMYVLFNGIQVLSYSSVVNLGLMTSVYIGSSISGGGYVGTISDISFSNIDRGSLFPNLPPDFISGDAVIMPAYTNQRRILSQAQMTQTNNGIVKVGTTGSSRGLATSRASGNWTSGDTITVTGMAGELISGVIDADTATATVIKDALSTDTVIYLDSVTGLIANDEIKFVDRVLGTVLATKTISSVDTTAKSVTLSATIGVALSKYNVVIMESTASSSVPTVNFLNGTTKTAITGSWSGLGTNVATFTLGTNASLLAQDIQLDYSLIMPSGQPALIAPTTTTLMGEAGIRIPASMQTITSDFSGKIAGRAWENPNVAKGITNNGSYPTLLTPSSDSWTEMSSTTYGHVSLLDGTVRSNNTVVNGSYAQQLFSFDLIKIAERKLGCKIPAKDTAGKIVWLKSNLNSTTPKWYGYGTSPTSNKAYLDWWRSSSSAYGGLPSTHTNSTVTVLSKTVDGTNSNLQNAIDSNGFIHFLAYADPSDGTTPSVINTDYVSLDVTFSNKIVNSSKLVTGQTVHVRDDFAGKTQGDTTGNPNLFKYYATDTALRSPASNWSELNNTGYSYISALDGTLMNVSNGANGSIPQFLASFNLIRIYEDKYGPIPAIDKVQWLKDNLAGFAFNYWGYGSSPTGNKATVAMWDGSIWVNATANNTTNAVAKIACSYDSTKASRLDANGFIHFLAYADASDGVTASTIYTDYCNIELTLKTSAFTGYDILSPENPRRDAGMSSILFVRKETKEVQPFLGHDTPLNLTSYSEYLPAPDPISANTDVTILAEIPEFLVTDLGSAVGYKQGTHHWMNPAYRVGQDNDNLAGEIGFSSVPFAPDSVGINIGNKPSLNGSGFYSNAQQQASLWLVSKPIVGIVRFLVMVNGEIKLLIFSKYSSNGVLDVWYTNIAFLIPLLGCPLTKELDGFVRNGMRYDNPNWKTNPLVVEGFVDKATNKLITG